MVPPAPAPTRIAVLGGTGFLGGAVVNACAAMGLDVWPVARTARAATGGSGGFRRSDLLTGAGLEEALSGADVVIHAAGLAHQHGGTTSAAMHAANVDGSRRAAEHAAAAGARRFVLVSSVSVYGGASALRTETARCAPTSPYGASKLAGERVVQRVAQERGIELIVLRMATIFGAGDPGNFARLIRMLDRGLPVGVDARTVSKSVIHRRDAADACVLAALSSTPTTGTFNVVGGVHSLDEIVSAAAAVLGRRSPRRAIPHTAAIGFASVLRRIPGTRPFGAAVQRLLAGEAYSGDAFGTAFRFTPRVALADGLTEEVAWLRSRGAVRT